MSELFVQVERVEDLIGRVDNYFGGERVMTVEEWKRKNPPIQKKPVTNADHIRSMSDAEIADFLCDIGECNRRCPAKIGDCFFSDSACRSAWLDWLKQEEKER